VSLDHLLLGILRSPASGYQLKQRLDDLFSHAWNADLPQIYRTLNRMERGGWLTVSAEPSDKGPDRRVYTRTPAGDAALRDWLRTEQCIELERTAHLAQVALLGELAEDRVALDLLHALRAEFEQALGVLQETARQWAAADPDYPDCRDDDDFYRQLTLDARIQELTGRVTWASRCIHRIGARLHFSLRHS